MEKPDLEVKSVFSCSSAGMHLLELKWKNITRWHKTRDAWHPLLLEQLLDDVSSCNWKSLSQVLLCRWHKAVCPRHAELEVTLPAPHDGKDELEFREDVLTYRLCWSPFDSVPLRLFVHLKIREGLRKHGGRAAAHPAGAGGPPMCVVVLHRGAFSIQHVRVSSEVMRRRRSRPAMGQIA